MSIVKAFIVPHPPLIVPEIGKGEENEIKNTGDALEKVGQQIQGIKPETIIVISPHSILYGDYLHISPGESGRGDFGRFGAPQVKLNKKYDQEFIDLLAKHAQAHNISAGTAGEKNRSLDHGVLVPLYFIERYYSDYRLVRISISGLSPYEHYQFGKLIAQTAQDLDRKTVLIASGDLSHKLTAEGPYGFAPEGPEFDRQVTAIMRSGEFLRLLDFDEDYCEKAAECGLRSFIVLAGALDGKLIKEDFLSYEGPFGVGYAVCAYDIGADDETRQLGKIYEKGREENLATIKNSEDEFVSLARLSLETYVKKGQYLTLPEGLPDSLLKIRAGVFVSIKKDGRLRGCIGTIAATSPSIANEIINNAVNAGTDDPRFMPIIAEELPYLVYSVDVMGEAEPIKNIAELDARRYGVIVSFGHRRGLLLPNLEGVDKPEQQIKIALSKAGISPEEDYIIERFEVVRHT